jgi:type IV secretion system protein VirD4
MSTATKACDTILPPSGVHPCFTKRVFNLNNIEIAEWAARRLRESTVYSQQIREGKAPNYARDFSYSEQRQRLMTAEQITGIKADDLLLLEGNRNPLKAKQNVYFKSKTCLRRFD